MATATVLTNAGAAIMAKRQIGGTPSQAEAKFLAWGTGGGSRTAAVGDTALTTEVTADGRATGALTNVTTTITNDTVRLIGTLTAVGAQTVNEAGVFDVVTSSTGNLEISMTFTGVVLGAGDSIQFTINKQFKTS